MLTAYVCTKIFNQAIADFHFIDSETRIINNPYATEEVDHLLYLKCWIDNEQWHFEDLIRDPNLDADAGMELKRQIDKSNQRRTDLVEKIDDWFVNWFKDVEPNQTAVLNTESPAWVLDRLSILVLKVYYMKEESLRTDVDEEHRGQSKVKLDILLEQLQDLSMSFDQLIESIKAGSNKMKVYRQMKLYNNPATKSALYKKK